MMKMINLHGIVIEGIFYYSSTLDEIEQRIRAIETLKAKNEQETIRLKFDAMQKLPDFIYDSDIGCRYRKVFDEKSLEIHYKLI